MLQVKLASIITALRTGQFQEYEALVFPCLQEDSESLWSALGAAHGSEVDLVGQLLLWPLDSLRSACHRLLPAVGRASTLTLSEAQGLLEFAERLEFSYRGMLADSLQPHITRMPTLGVKLGEQLRVSGIQCDSALRVWAGAFSSAAPQEAAIYAQRLATGDVRDTRMLSVLLLFLPFGNTLVRSILTVDESKLAALLRGAVPELGVDAWTALTCLADISPTAVSSLSEALGVAEQQAVFAVSNWLYKISTPTLGASTLSLDHLVRRLLALAVKDEQYRASIDSGIASLLHRSALRGLVLSSVVELGTVDAKVAEHFSEILDAVCDKPDDFVKVLTDWLLRPDVSLVALGSLLSCCTTERAPSSLDATAFAMASTEQRVKAARRLLALTHHGPTLCQFIASIAEMTALGIERLEITAQMLNEALMEYPGATEGFLKAQTRPSSRNELQAAVYRGVYASALRWRRILARLSTLKELRPTDSERHALRSMKRRMNRDILRGAAERSVFAGLFTSVHLAQGKRFASHTKLGSPQVVEMAQASHSIELPSSELADPMRGMLQRMMLLRSAR